MLKFALLLALAFTALLAACSATPTTDRPPASYTLTVTVLPSHFGRAVALDPPPGQGGSYASGTVVRLTTSPPVHHECKDTPYWEFIGWSGDVQGSASTVEIRMDSDKSLTAGFKEFFPPRCPTTQSCENPNLEISVKGDILQFDTDGLQVAAGSEVVLCFSNESRLSQHNWVMVKAGTKDDVAKRGLEAGPDNDYVQPEDPDVIAHTRLVNPGETGEVRFTAAPAGTYQFVCTFPGHNFTMFGDFVVTP
jgi:azurin